ncbi:hypothetical protein [Marinobacter sp. CHS3-4]|uniref:hypothetical protein n=1 Tax=Marinobacter sp. CHS3-4 TaxID=3045174 RepID=UPI0024B52134|nr:hypothetical protein [Marinobacter sp. CHS3-4]MDI9243846.1 hypothetical protein [Marinobacter sp. CHS3-4]
MNIVRSVTDAIVVVLGAVMVGASLYGLFLSPHRGPNASIVANMLVIVIGSFLIYAPFRKRKKNHLQTEIVESNFSGKHIHGPSGNAGEPVPSALYYFGSMFIWLGHIIVALCMLGVVVLIFFISPGGTSGVPLGIGIMGAMFLYLVDRVLRFYGAND